MRFLIFTFLFSNFCFSQNERHSSPFRISTESENSLSIEECDYNFSIPNLSFSFIDNRKMCCFCERSLSKYSTVEDFTNKKNFSEAEYIQEQLIYHLRINKGDESHVKKDFARYTEFIKDNYGSIAPLVIFSSLLQVPISISFGQMLNSIPKEPSTFRKINKYNITSKFCTNECASKCSSYGKDCVGCD